MKGKKQQKLKQQILNTIPIFLAKTYKIVDNPQYQDIISWSQDGQGFIVKDINKLTTEIFPKHFKHSNFASFVRQLNMYGFHKIKSEKQGHVFIHQAFQKDEVYKLQEIKRKNGNTPDLQQGNETNMMVLLRRAQQGDVQKELSSIRHKHEDLQGFVSMLVDQNKQILMQNRNFVNKMSKMEQKYRNKLQTLMLLLLFGKAKNSNGQPFILPQQFQNMLASFGDAGNGKAFQLSEEGIKKKKPKRQSPLKMIKNYSETDGIIKQIGEPMDSEQNDDIDNILNTLGSQKKQRSILKDDADDSLVLVPPSPNHSFISFPQLYDKDSHHDVSQFLDKLQHSDYEDQSAIDQKLN